MNYIKNLSPLLKLAGSMNILRKKKKEIKAARAAGDVELEYAKILESTTEWGNWLKQKFKVDFNVCGKENLPDRGPVVFVCNHQGYADIAAFFVAIDTIPFAFIAKKELLSIPFFGDWMKEIHCVPINRGNPRDSLKAINEGVALLNNGFSMAIFPERTRSRCEKIGEFKPGAFKLAYKAGVPIIPVAINGTWKTFEKDGYFHGGETIDLHIMPMHETAGLDRKGENELSAQVEAEIRAEFDKLVELRKARENDKE